MTRWLLAAFALVLISPLARGHFIWIVPDDKGGTAKLYFSEGPTPDDPELLNKIGHTEVRGQIFGQKAVPVKLQLKDNAYLLAPEGDQGRNLLANCKYGVITRAGTSFLLHYYARGYLPSRIAEPAASVSSAPDERLPFEISRDGRTRYLVLWQGKPLADAEVVIAKPGKEKPVTMKSDKDGGFDFIAEAVGTYGIRARHIEKKEGEHDGKKYTEVRHYTTLVVEGSAKEDPAASKLLADARAARALWKEFPGFSADIEINLDGKISKGTVTVDSNGKAKYEGLSKEAEAWAKPIFGSIVGHRLDGTPRNTPCAFVDEEVNHPMGRRIRVLNDELHSGYRIKDDQILVVDRHVESRKFTISVLENRKNAEGKYLPVSFVVDYWNPKSGELLRSDATFQSWKRVGSFDLPVTARIVTAEKLVAKSEKIGEKSETVDTWKEAPVTRVLTLSNHKLAK